MQLLHQGVDLMFIKEPHINTEYYKRMQNRKYEIAHTGKKSIDNLIQSVLDAITVFQDEETLEKYASHFNNPKRKLQICTNVFQKELRLSNVIIRFFPCQAKTDWSGQR